MSVFTLFCGICAPAAWASLGAYFPAAVMDRVFWPGEHMSELGLLTLEQLLPGLQKQAMHFIEGCFASRPLHFFISP